MFTALAFVAASSLAVTPGAAGDAASPPAPEQVAAVPGPAKRAPSFGLLFDAGIPEGVGASFAWLPLKWLRLHAGPSTNGIALGGRGSASLLLPGGIVRPTLTFSGGKFAEGNARRIVRLLARGLGADARALTRVAYDFADAHVGFEVGSPHGASVFLRGGISRTVLHLPALPEFLRSAAADTASPPESATLTVVAPSVQLGLVLYLP